MKEMKKKGGRIILILLVSIFSLWGCLQKDQNTTPKPKGYFRLSVPKHEYVNFNSLPYCSFQYEKSCKIEIEKKQDDSYWITLSYPQQNATLNLTYIPLHNNLKKLVLDEENFINFHIEQGKADDVEYSFIQAPKLIGKIYDLRGKDVATPLQVWMSDSINHFIRGSLYFNFAPNNDSLMPVINYLREDVMHIVNTIEWKN